GDRRIVRLGRDDDLAGGRDALGQGLGLGGERGCGEQGAGECEAKHGSLLDRLENHFRTAAIKSRVRGCWGETRICSGVPRSTISPLSMKITSLATSRAKPSSCVTTIMV